MFTDPDDWIAQVAYEIAQRYAMRNEVESEAIVIMRMIERACPLPKTRRESEQ